MKITFITYHNWETKRIGGFHKLAQYAAEQGHEVIFFSFARPYYIAFKKEERLNLGVLKELSKGVSYPVKHGTITNCTWPTLSVPGPLRKFLPSKFITWLEHCSFSSFNKFYNKFLLNSDVYIYESCEAIILFDKLKAIAPHAKHIYRPSDPMMIDGCTSETLRLEKNIILKCDLNLIVNAAGVNLYERKINDFKKKARYTILKNGVDTEAFQKNYPVPLALQKPNTALYVGAIAPNWSLIHEAAKALPEVNFVIVCPVLAPSFIQSSVLNNLVYIPGIRGNEVPQYVTNCSLIIVPNQENLFKKRPWGITAKYYQAMAACKPIVAFSDTSELKDYGVAVCDNFESFIESIRTSTVNTEKMTYSYKTLDWEEIGDDFLKTIQDL